MKKLKIKPMKAKKSKAPKAAKENAMGAKPLFTAPKTKKIKMMKMEM